jgi:hypothetical protein
MQGVLDTTNGNKVCHGLVTDQWFSPGTLVFSTNKTDFHDITEIGRTKHNFYIEIAMDIITQN